MLLQDKTTKSVQQKRPSPIWLPRAIPHWEVASKDTIITQERQLELWHATQDPIEVDLVFKQVVPSYSLFSGTDNQLLFLYNWTLASTMWFYLLETQNDVKSYSQNSQAWRETLVNRFSAKSDPETLRLKSLQITPCSDAPPISPWKLSWRDIPVPDQQALMDPSFLAVLMWEISEAAFLYSLLQLDNYITSRSSKPHSKKRKDKRDDLLVNWHGHLSLTPQFEGERPAESQNILHTRKELVLALCEFMSDWPRFPVELNVEEVRKVETTFGLLYLESTLIAFYCQIFADHYSRLPPLPCIRPSLPHRNN